MLEVLGPDDRVYMGGSQEWYGDPWQRKAGCGPTAASNMVWYLARTRPPLTALCDIRSGSQDEFIRLMEEMFAYITPGKGGVNTTKIFTQGAARFGDARQRSLAFQVMEIPMRYDKRPKPKEAGRFILDALEADVPVAFLNLSNGALRNLDKWHWVTIFALDPESMMATICDQGRFWDIELERWLRTTVLGGGFIYLKEAV
jgi:hypothetical protein